MWILFGSIRDRQMCANGIGRMVQEAWFELPDHFPRLELDSFQLMPNPVHGILALKDPVGAALRPARAPRLRKLLLVRQRFRVPCAR